MKDTRIKASGCVHATYMTVGPSIPGLLGPKADRGVLPSAVATYEDPDGI